MICNFNKAFPHIFKRSIAIGKANKTMNPISEKRNSGFGISKMPKSFRSSGIFAITK